MFFSALPLGICRFKLRWSSRCNRTASVCLFPFDGWFMEWPNVLPLLWHLTWDIFWHYFNFEGKNVTTPQYVQHFLSRSYKRRSTKRCTRMHAYWPYAIHWGDLYLLDIPRSFCTWARPGTPHGRNLLRFWWPRSRYNPIYWVIRKYCVNVVVTRVLRVILDVEFDGTFIFTSDLRSRSGQGQVK